MSVNFTTVAVAMRDGELVRDSGTFTKAQAESAITRKTVRGYEGEEPKAVRKAIQQWIKKNPEGRGHVRALVLEGKSESEAVESPAEEPKPARRAVRKAKTADRDERIANLLLAVIEELRA